jgi:hypothetical protein
LNANQQLGGTVGVAVLGTVFFDLFDAGRSTGAMVAVLLLSAGLVLAAGALAFLLPRRGGLSPHRSKGPCCGTGARALEAGPGQPALPQCAVADRLDAVGRSAAHHREQELDGRATDGDVPLAVPVLPHDPPACAADEPLPRSAELGVGGVQVHGDPVGEGGSAGSGFRAASRPRYSDTPSAARSAGSW